MLYKSENVIAVNNVLPLKIATVPTLVVAMAMTTAVFAGAGWEEAVDVSKISGRAQVEQNDFKALEDLTLRQGLILTREEIRSMLEINPEGLAAANERGADQQALLATAPAKFEVVGDAVITPPTGGGMIVPARAGGSFNNGTDLEAFLNYTVKSTHIAFYGRAADGEVIGELANQGFGSKGYGVYGATGLIDGYGVYARNWAPTGDSTATGGGVALFATGSIVGAYTVGGHNDLDNHVAVIENKSIGRTHVLALSMPNDSVLGSADNFVTFYHGGTTASDAQGSIEGVAGSGVNYNTSSADFAEWVPRRDISESIEAGDVVGIADGKVSRDVAKADHIQVVSTAPAFTGNDPGFDKRDQYALLSMMGQVPVKVTGKVSAGDYIVASGKNNGIGIAVAADRMTTEDFRLMAGRAWESSDEQGVKLINAAVGLGAGDAYTYMRKQDQRIASLEQNLSSKMAEQNRHLAILEKQLSIRQAKLDRLAAQMDVLTRKLASIHSSNMMVRASR